MLLAGCAKKPSTATFILMTVAEASCGAASRPGADGAGATGSANARRPNFRRNSAPCPPDIIARHKQFGHREADLVLFRQKYGPANVTTLTERTSRFLVALKNVEKRTKPIMAQIAQALTPLPRHAC